jgi:hypothetical protein
MLSNTADTKPKPSAVCQMRGQFLDRHHRGAGDERQQEDRALEGLRHHRQSGCAQGAAERITAHTASRSPGMASSRSGNLQVGDDVGEDRHEQDGDHDANAQPFDLQVARRLLHDRRVAVLLQRGRNAEKAQRDPPPRTPPAR